MSQGYKKIIVPELPDWKALKKYVKRIDDERVYANFGKLNLELMHRLKTHWGYQVNVTTTSSGTSALIGAILAKTSGNSPAKKICILPSYTFIGTISAVISSGFIPFLMDINPETWDMNIENIKQLSIFDETGLVIPVSVYGKNVNLNKWEEFSDKYNIPVIIDAAASFDTLNKTYLEKLQNCVICLSFHATKIFGTAEGGCIITNETIEQIPFVRAVNFGFYYSRESIGRSINGKMSEYHAAIGLAGLDHWKNKHDKYKFISELYKKYAGKFNLQNRILCGNPVSLTYCFYLNNSPKTNSKILNFLNNCEIDCRTWYGDGLHNHPVYRKIKRSGMNNTSILANKIIGLPMHTSLNEDDIEYIVEKIAKI